MKKRCSLAQVFSCEVSKNSFFTEHLWTTASPVFFLLLAFFGITIETVLN